MRDLFRAITELDAAHVLRIGFGLEPNSLLAVDLCRELIGYKRRTMSRDRRNRLDEFGFGPVTVLDLPWSIWTYLALRRRIKRIRILVRAIVEDKRTERQDDTNWIDGLVHQRLSIQEIADNLNHLYGAFTAIDLSITAALYELSKHPEWRYRIRTELDSVLGPRQFPTREDFPRLVDTLNVMREVFRMYPVAMGIFRQTGKPVLVDGEWLPSKTQMMILPYALHHHPEFWRDSDRFDPDRWSGSGEPEVPFSYIPFLEGPRKCTGQQFAEREFVVVLSALLRRFDVEVLDHHVGLTPFLIPRFESDLPFRVHTAS